MRIDWKQKLTSRKLWLAVAGFVSGVIVACGGTASTASTVSGVILQGATVVGYLLAEGLADAAGTHQEPGAVSLDRGSKNSANAPAPAVEAAGGEHEQGSDV